MIKITYYGHSCFTLESKGFCIAIDPYDERTNYPPLKLKADAVYCSHEHGDHAYIEAVELSGKEGNPFVVEELIVPHDHEGGHKRGLNKIRIFQSEGIKVAHFGDTGCMPDDCLLEKLKGLDAALIPVGGFFTIDADEAKAIADAIEPKTIIPMHYKCADAGLQIIAGVEDFTSKYENAVFSEDCCIEIDNSNKGVVVLKRKDSVA